jgi:diaminopimelate epimerase
MQDQVTRPFVKMHGLGNDFVVVDARQAPFDLSDARARRIADRREGVGCDQLVVIQPPSAGSGADVYMHLRNADGGEIGACGNATRCVAARIMAETGRDAVTVETKAGLLHARDTGAAGVAVDMGPPRLDWREIPLAEAQDTLALHLLGALDMPGADALPAPVAVNMGNPHAVFFVADAEQVPLAEIGPRLEHAPLFPERANISFATLDGPDRLRLRVWERGAGITRACGTAACAATVAAIRRGEGARRMTVALDGGDLAIEWRDSDGHVIMAGPVAESFTGTMSRELLSP